MASSCLVLLLTSVAVLVPAARASSRETPVCQPIRVPICQGLGYNVTSAANLDGQRSQEDVDHEIQTFAPLMQYGCSSQLRFFLCSVHLPMCTDKVSDSIGPCRPLCQRVKNRCQPVLQEFGFPWPSILDCDKFPEENMRPHMCMEGPGEKVEPPPPVVKSADASLDPLPRLLSSASDAVSLAKCAKLREASEYFFINRTEKCSHKCSSDILFSRDNKSLAETWLLIWSIVCLLTSGFAVCSFIYDSKQFRFPERIIVIMSFTYLMYSLGHVVRLVLGRQVVSCHTEPQHNVSLLISEGPDNLSCTLVFVVTYFFGMASALWWVNLTITWFLSAGLNWSAEAIEQKSSHLHFVAWLLPSIQTLAILIMRAVDADELTGSCFVGSHSNDKLLAFVLIPSSFYLGLGSLFLFARHYCNCRPSATTAHPPPPALSQHSLLTGSSSSHHSVALSRRFNNNDYSGSSSQSPKKVQQLLNWKLSCFTLFYMLSAFFNVAFTVYEYVERDSWYLADSPDRPSLELYMIKIFMNFVVGIQSGLWVWSLKTRSRPYESTLTRAASKGSAHSRVTCTLAPSAATSCKTMTPLPSSCPLTTREQQVLLQQPSQPTQAGLYRLIDHQTGLTRSLWKGETTV